MKTFIVCFPGVNKDGFADKDWDEILPTICPTINFNQSESIRLETQLRGWFNTNSSSSSLSLLDQQRATRKTAKRKARKRLLGSGAGGALSHRRQMANYLKQANLPNTVYHMFIEDDK